MSKNKEKSTKEYWNRNQQRIFAGELALIYSKRFTLQQAFNRGYLFRKEKILDKTSKIKELEAEASLKYREGKKFTQRAISQKIKEADYYFLGEQIQDVDKLLLAYIAENGAYHDLAKQRVVHLETISRLKKQVDLHDQQNIARLSDLSTMQNKVDNAETMINHYKVILKDMIKD